MIAQFESGISWKKKEEAVLEGHKAHINTMRITSDNKYIISGEVMVTEQSESGIF